MLSRPYSRALRLTSIHPISHSPHFTFTPFHLIMHLSAPQSNSVNSFIDKSAFSFTMISVDTIADHVRSHGTGALMCKVDLKQVFCLCPVHPDDRPLLGMLWRGKFYFDTVLPFGLRSAPYIFNRLADALQWVLQNRYGIPCLEHNLDDFISVSPPSTSPPPPPTSTAAVHMATIIQVLQNLQVPIDDGTDKVVGPSTCATILGVKVDSVAGELRLPPPSRTSCLPCKISSPGRSGAARTDPRRWSTIPQGGAGALASRTKPIM